MSEFRPHLETILTIGTGHYSFQPHPLIPSEVQKIPREQATTYRLTRLEDQTQWALKINHNSQHRRIVALTEALRRYKDIPGLSVTHRVCLTRALQPKLIAQYPALEYAVLMPWIMGITWAGFMDDPVASAQYRQKHACQLALTTAHVLWNLEAHHLTHTDIAGDNVILLIQAAQTNQRKAENLSMPLTPADEKQSITKTPNSSSELAPSFDRVEFIDLEGCYVPGVPAPAQRSRGWQGYQHPYLDQRGNYRPDGDRFAGAMLLTEMLTWWNSQVRAATPDEYDALFQNWNQEPPEKQHLRLKVIRNTLWNINPRLCGLFDQAWMSPDLAKSPDFSAWALSLLEVQK